MSRKNFIITALLINLTICITLCIVVLTDNDNNDIDKVSTKEVIEEEENTKDFSKENKQTEDIEDTKDTDSTSEEDSSSYEIGVILDNESDSSENKEDESDTEIIESQVQSDTPPVTYINYNGITLSNQEGTTINNQEETTKPQEETTIVVNGTNATITQSCNIRSQADMSSSSRIGTANVGSNYKIEPQLCSQNWIAIYLEDNSIGYVSSSFCVIN